MLSIDVYPYQPTLPSQPLLRHPPLLLPAVPWPIHRRRNHVFGDTLMLPSSRFRQPRQFQFKGLILAFHRAACK